MEFSILAAGILMGLAAIGAGVGVGAAVVVVVVVVVVVDSLDPPQAIPNKIGKQLNINKYFIFFIVFINSTYIS